MFLGIHTLTAARKEKQDKDGDKVSPHRPLVSLHQPPHFASRHLSPSFSADTSDARSVLKGSRSHHHHHGLCQRCGRSGPRPRVWPCGIKRWARRGAGSEAHWRSACLSIDRLKSRIPGWRLLRAGPGHPRDWPYTPRCGR